MWALRQLYFTAVLREHEIQNIVIFLASIK